MADSETEPHAISINRPVDVGKDVSLLSTIWQQIYQSTIIENSSELLETEMETMPWASLECSLTIWNIQPLGPTSFS